MAKFQIIGFVRPQASMYPNASCPVHLPMPTPWRRHESCVPVPPQRPTPTKSSHATKARIAADVKTNPEKRMKVEMNSSVESEQAFTAFVERTLLWLDLLFYLLCLPIFLLLSCISAFWNSGEESCVDLHPRRCGYRQGEMVVVANVAAGCPSHNRRW
jgi:hypothetical protein